MQRLSPSSGLTSNDMAAHIHCCAPLGTNVGVATTVPAFPGFPLGVTSGTYSSVVFDLTQPTIYNPAFVTLEGALRDSRVQPQRNYRGQAGCPGCPQFPCA